MKMIVVQKDGTHVEIEVINGSEAKEGIDFNVLWGPMSEAHIFDKDGYYEYESVIVG